MPRRSERALQLHLWVDSEDVRLLRQLALERDQSVSGVVRYLLRCVRRQRTRTETLGDMQSGRAPSEEHVVHKG